MFMSDEMLLQSPPKKGYETVSDKKSYCKRWHKVGTRFYLGKALEGSPEGAKVWQILVIDSTTLTKKIQYADGDSNFNKVWTDHETLNYL